MNILFWALTTGVIGKVMLAAGVIIAHTGLAHEKRINKTVLFDFKLELWLTVIGLLLILLGYGMEIYFYGLTPLLTCDSANCAAAVSAVLIE